MTLPTLPTGIGFTLVIAMIIDTICATKRAGGKRLSTFAGNTSLLIATALIYILIYLMDLINSKYVWIAFIVGLSYLIVIDIISNKKLIKKLTHIIGLVIISLIILFYFCFTRYELQTTFYQPCWSPSGKQIAFFMGKDLYRYHLGFPFSLWSPDDIWKKYYLCTMDYDGGNFKILREADSQGVDRQKYLEYYSVMWPNAETIVYNQLMQDNFHSGKFQGESYKIHPDGTGLEKLWKWDEQTEYHGIPWLSPQEDYFMLYKSSGTVQVYAIYDRKKKEIKKTLSYSDVNLDWYGSYRKNEIALIVRQIDPKIIERVLVKYDIDRDKIEEQKIMEIGYLEDLKRLDGFEYTFASRSYSPDRSMYAEKGSKTEWHSNSIFIVNTNKLTVGEIVFKTKRSYLFNIFGK